MTATHGTVIVCEREGGATVAWVDERISREVPNGYFVEWWPEKMAAYAGTMAQGYEPKYRFIDGTCAGKFRWLDWYDAIVWCRNQVRNKRQREAA